MMGFDCETFDKILDKFGPMFSSHTPFDESGFIVPYKYNTLVVGRENFNQKIVWDWY
jgi:hypothetical protein